MAKDDSSDLLTFAVIGLLAYGVLKSGKLNDILARLQGGGAPYVPPPAPTIPGIPTPPTTTPAPTTPGTPPVTTVPDVPVSGDFSFAAAGDFRPGPSAFVSALSKTNIPLILGLGDYAYSQSPDAWMKVYAPLKSKTKPCKGNHDGGSTWLGLWGIQSWTYGFKMGNCYFICCDTEGSNPHVQSECVKAMADPGVKFIIAYYHRPYVTCSCSHGPDGKAQAINNILEKYTAKCKLVLTGHNHNYQRFKPINGITYCVVGTADKDSYAVSGGGANSVIQNTSANGYLHVTPTANSLVCKFVPISGSFTDSFTIT